VQRSRLQAQQQQQQQPLLLVLLLLLGPLLLLAVLGRVAQEVRGVTAWTS
jgi:hypothetical protein